MRQSRAWGPGARRARSPPSFQPGPKRARDPARGRWLRPTREDMIQLRTNEGELLYFKPGNTFFQIMRLPEELDPDEEGFSIQ